MIELRLSYEVDDRGNVDVYVNKTRCGWFLMNPDYAKHHKMTLEQQAENIIAERLREVFKYD